MFSLPVTLEKIISENRGADWLAFLITFAGVLVVLYFARRILVARLARLAERTANRVDDVLAETFSRTRLIFLIGIAIWMGSRMLILPPAADAGLNKLVIILLLIQAGIWMNSVLGFVVRHFVRLEIEDAASQVATSMALTFIGRLVLWSVLLLVALDNIGVDINALITGLGIGGIAVALAAQNILGDLFASLSIMFDKPFVLGDFIVVGDLMGTVEKIGMKTTRVRALSGEQLIFSNNDLLSSRIRNLKRMQERRVVFTVGVTYQTPADKLERIPAMIREIIEKQEQTRFDRSHFLNWGDSALLIETVYWVLGPEFQMYADIHQRVNLAIYRKFEEEGIEFAYPTRTVHLVR